jgi:hypothetical protein
LAIWPLQPERNPWSVHGLVDHGDEFRAQGIQVDLVAKVGVEGLNGLAAPIHHGLGTATQRLEHRRHGKGGAGDGQARVLAN